MNYLCQVWFKKKKQQHCALEVLRESLLCISTWSILGNSSYKANPAWSSGSSLKVFWTIFTKLSQLQIHWVARWAVDSVTLSSRVSFQNTQGGKWSPTLLSVWNYTSRHIDSFHHALVLFADGDHVEGVERVAEEPSATLILLPWNLDPSFFPLQKVTVSIESKLFPSSSLVFVSGWCIVWSLSPNLLSSADVIVNIWISAADGEQLLGHNWSGCGINRAWRSRPAESSVRWWSGRWTLSLCQCVFWEMISPLD